MECVLFVEHLLPAKTEILQPHSKCVECLIMVYIIYMISYADIYIIYQIG